MERTGRMWGEAGKDRKEEGEGEWVKSETAEEADKAEAETKES